MVVVEEEVVVVGGGGRGGRGTEFITVNFCEGLLARMGIDSFPVKPLIFGFFA